MAEGLLQTPPLDNLSGQHLVDIILARNGFVRFAVGVNAMVVAFAFQPPAVFDEKSD